ncbi:MAG: hypothetical protein PUJ11_00150 [Eubacteriaceae bacterium]|nr:hypothetical protein [Eubacteriaceae bacterium]
MERKDVSAKFPVIVSAAIITAYICRIVTVAGTDLQVLHYLRTAIYLSLFAGWGFSLNNRIREKRLLKNAAVGGSAHSKRRLWLPAVPLALSVLYLVLREAGSDRMELLLGNPAVVYGLMSIALFETCIKAGLIQSYSTYEDLFSSMVNCSIQILDSEYNVKYECGDRIEISKAQVQEALRAPLNIKDGMTLHAISIRDGYEVWTEDNSQLLALTEELENTREELQDRVCLLSYEYEREKNQREIEEQNQLYDLLQAVTQRQTDRIEQLAEMYRPEEKDSETSKAVLAKIAVLCSYIKRRKHLTLLAYRDDRIPLSELESALGESLRTLELLGVDYSIFVQAEDMLDSVHATAAYDFFEDVVEMGFDTLQTINVRMARIDGKLRITVFAVCEGNLSTLENTYPDGQFDREEDEWVCLLTLNNRAEGGEEE